MGFTFPISKWLRKDLKNWSEDLIFSRKSRGIELNNIFIKKLWDEHMSEKFNHQDMLWTILQYKSWEQEHLL